MFVYNYFWPAASPSSTLTQPRLEIRSQDRIDAKIQKLLDLLAKNTTTEAFLFQTYSPKVIKSIKAALIQSKISENHPAVKKIEAVLARHYPGISQDQRNRIETGYGYNPCNFSYRAIENVRIEHGKIQETLPLEDLKKLIQERGQEITQLDLTAVDDETLHLAVQHCPQLKALNIKPLTSQAMADFSDLGLCLIAVLENLKSLTLDCWDAIYLSSEALEKMVNGLQGKGKLEALNICHPLLSDAGLASIAQCKNLNSLTLQGGWMLTAQGLEKLLQSSLLKASLQKISLSASYDRKIIYINDAMLLSLSSYPKLTDLSLAGDWQITDPNILKFLEAKKNLARLSLKGISMSDAMAEKISRYPLLISLTLSDCTNLSLDGYMNVFKDKGLLAQLDLGKAVWLGSDGHCERKPLQVLSQLPSLTSLSLSGCSYMGNADFDEFCDSRYMQRNLAQLFLNGLPSVGSASLGNISQLDKLTVLRIDNCPWFNEEAFEAFLKSEASENLYELHLNRVSITDKCIAHLDKLPNLKKLILGNCYALTGGGIFEGRETLFDLAIKKQLIGLALDRYLFSDAAAKKIADFTDLQLLLVFNNSEITDKGLQTLRNIQVQRGEALNFTVEFGDKLDVYRDFEKGFPESA